MKANPAALIAIRSSQGISQAELARRSGVSQGHISGIEAGEKSPSVTTIKKLADALAVPMAALATATEPVA